MPKFAKDRPAACYKMLFEGSCSREKCTLTHDPKVLAAMGRDLGEALQLQVSIPPE